MNIKFQINEWMRGTNTPFGKQEMDIQDKMAMKKQLHQKEAMHVVTVANKSEKKIDDSVEERKARISQIEEDNKEANSFLNDIKQQMAQVKEDYGIEDDSEEQKDLELLQKVYDMQKHGSTEGLTADEMERLANMGELTEYQKQSMELYGQADYWKTKLSDNQREIAGESKLIRSIKIERLKKHGMVDAQNAKEEILEAASKEAIGMLLDDAKQNIDDKAEEVKEEAEERKEEEEEQEKRIEVAKENRAEAEAQVEKTRENIEDMTYQMLESDDITRDIEDEVKKIMEEEKLLEEDLKGLAVDAGA